MALFLLIVLTLLHVASNLLGSQYPQAFSDNENVLSSENPQPALYVLDLNKHINSAKSQYKWNSIFNIASLLPYIVDDNDEPSQNDKNEDTCTVMANDNENIVDLINRFQRIPSSPLRQSNAVLLCERNCTHMALKICSSCIDATLNILSYSCRRKCQLSEGQSEFLHDKSVHPGPEYMCSKRHEEHSRCCKDNCFRSIFKQCWFKKQRLCTTETVRILKGSCISKCERGSKNPYLNAFCSFVFKYKKQRTKHILMNMSSTYFWEKSITAFPLSAPIK